MPRRRNTALAGAARRIDLQKKEADGYRRKAQAKAWQQDAFAYFSALGIVKQSTYSLANTCSLVRLFVAFRPDPEQDPVPAPDGMAGVAEGRDALERLAAGAKGGHAGLINRAIVQLKVPGECWLVGLEEEEAKPPSQQFPDGVPAKPEEWLIGSISEIESKGDDYVLKRTAGQKEGRRLDRQDDFLLRIWQEDGEFAEEPDSALRGALGDCEEYLILSRAVRATGRSRIAGAGIFVVPSEADLGPVPPLNDDDEEEAEQEEVDDPQAAAFSKKLLDAMVTAIAEEGDASAVAPIVLRAPGEHCDKFRHITFDRPADNFGEQRQQVIERLGMQLDIPLEEVIGITGGQGPVFMSGNTASQMDQKLWNRYGQPAMTTLCESLSVGFLRPMIEGAGLEAAVADQLLVWFDPGPAIADPDPSESADEAIDRGVISESSYRTSKGYSDDDAPSDEERQRRHDLGLLGRSSGSPFGEQQPQAMAAAQAPRPLAAAARRDLGERLARIDRELRLRLKEIAEGALLRALERAGARVRNKAAKSPTLRASVSSTPAFRVPAKLSRGVVADALGFTDDDLLAGQFDDAQPRFDKRVSQAQAQTRAALADELDLDEAELASLERSQDRDRHEAWLWFAGAMTALAHTRLYNPEPAAPARGEHDSSALVPETIVREAMARAGGAAGGGEAATQAGRAPGGVALGELVQDLWSQHGRVVSGWQWAYGDPGSRTTPFEPHFELDGVEFSGWDDPVLANGEGFPEDAFFRPGDHDGCQCDFVPLGLSDSAAEEPALAGAE